MIEEDNLVLFLLTYQPHHHQNRLPTYDTQRRHRRHILKTDLRHILPQPLLALSSIFVRQVHREMELRQRLSDQNRMRDRVALGNRAFPPAFRIQGRDSRTKLGDPRRELDWPCCVRVNQVQRRLW